MRHFSKEPRGTYYRFPIQFRLPFACASLPVCLSAAAEGASTGRLSGGNRFSLNIKMEKRMKYILRLFFAMVYLFISVNLLRAQIQTDVPALKDVYARDFYIGCLLSYKYVGFASDPVVPGQSAVVDTNGGYLIRYHMNSMSPGNNMKPEYTFDDSASAAAYLAASPEDRDSVNVHPIIRFNGDMIAQLNWARRQGFTFRGHTLVWHAQTPVEFFYTGYSTSNGRVAKEVMIERMDNYIGEIIRLIHEGWPGLLSALDVVNEAIDDGADAVRTAGNEWYTTFGDSTYIMQAFESARRYTVLYGETQIKLYYNDYSTSDPAKADAIVRLLTPIFAAGYLDGIGMQEHDFIHWPSADDWIVTYNKFYPLCHEMAVTEMDIRTGTTDPSPEDLALQANQYGQLFKCFLDRSYRSGRGKIINVSKDGLNDKYTFWQEATSLWDSTFQCKPAFYAVAGVGINYNALDSLIALSEPLMQNRYTPASWNVFAAALSSARNAMSQNYSYLVSADTALGAAKDNLEAAVSGLVPASPFVLWGLENGVTGGWALDASTPGTVIIEGSGSPTGNTALRCNFAASVALGIGDSLTVNGTVSFTVGELAGGVTRFGVFNNNGNTGFDSSGVWTFSNGTATATGYSGYLVGVPANNGGITNWIGGGTTPASIGGFKSGKSNAWYSTQSSADVGLGGTGAVAGPINGGSFDFTITLHRAAENHMDIAAGFVKEGGGFSYSAVAADTGINTGGTISTSAFNSFGFFTNQFSSVSRLAFTGFMVHSSVVNVSKGSTVLPQTFALSQNYPNPFNPTTVISYRLPVMSRVSMGIYDILGRRIASLVDEVKLAGSYSVIFDASALSSGVYFYRIQAALYTETKKLVVLK
jgi:GH35 family endo-1,4-beta-xylanase